MFFYLFFIMSTASQSRGSVSPGQVAQVPLPHHAPMSERQQLALIKRLELAATSSNGTPNNGENLRFCSTNFDNYYWPFLVTAVFCSWQTTFWQGQAKAFDQVIGPLAVTQPFCCVLPFY